MRNKLVALRLEDAGDTVIVTGFKPNEKNRKAVWRFTMAKSDRAEMPAEVARQEEKRLANDKE